MGVCVLESIDKIKEFKEEVCKQIRWKRVHESISKELNAHLEDQLNYYISNGETETDAINMTIKDMGDPIDVGVQLDRVHRPKSQKNMIIFVGILLLIGLFIQAFLVYDSDYSLNLPKQIIGSIMGIGIMLLAYYGDYTLIGKYSRFFFTFTCVLSILLLLTSSEVNGKPYFVGLVSFSLAYFSLLFPILLVGVIYVTRKKGYAGLMIVVLTTFVLTFLTYITSSFGNAVFTLITGVVLISVSINKKWYSVKRLIGYLLVILPIISALLIGYIENSFYLLPRLELAINPTIEADGRGYIGTMLRTILHNSIFIGRGTTPEQYSHIVFLEQSIQPEYLLSHLIFNRGWITFYIIIALFTVFIMKGFFLALKQKTMLGLLVSLAVLITLTFEASVYIAWNLGFMLISPIALPLISYGNTALIVNLFLIGIMLSVFRCDSIVTDAWINYRKGKFITWNDGCLTIDFRKQGAN
ncbi:MAG: hypothetical protein K0S61_763 [Anaerocolumna sp.]|jgi:cell division protein FtsW (lipid II flippase)|nr:hypothetical protein [Anaerocolumna sp.]